LEGHQEGIRERVPGGDKGEGSRRDGGELMER